MRLERTGEGHIGAVKRSDSMIDLEVARPIGCGYVYMVSARRGLRTYQGAFPLIQ